MANDKRDTKERYHQCTGETVAGSGGKRYIECRLVECGGVGARQDPLVRSALVGLGHEPCNGGGGGLPAPTT